MVPETHYAKKGDISIAYQVVGDGPIDLVFSSGIVSQMALMWSDAAGQRDAATPDVLRSLGDVRQARNGPVGPGLRATVT